VDTRLQIDGLEGRASWALEGRLHGKGHPHREHGSTSAKLLGSFIYSDSVPEMEEEEDDVTWQHLLAVADGYDLWRLRLICE
jgi:hypothetical protein